jgi:hypothetical protein
MLVFNKNNFQPSGKRSVLGTATRPLPTVVQRVPHGRASVMVGMRCETHTKAPVMVNTPCEMHGIASMTVGKCCETCDRASMMVGNLRVPIVSARVPYIPPRQPHGSGGVLNGERCGITLQRDGLHCTTDECLYLQ